MEDGSGDVFDGLLDVVTRCGLGAAFKQGICWTDGSGREQSWLDWSRCCFQPFILPHLLEVQALWSHHCVREILGRDREFSDVLSDETRRRSVEAGQRLLLEKLIKTDRTLDRVQQAVQAGEAPGHFPTLFAVRAAVFSIAPQTAVMAYLLQELVCWVADPEDQTELLALGLSGVNGFLRQSAELEPETAPSNA